MNRRRAFAAYAFVLSLTALAVLIATAMLLWTEAPAW